MTVRQLIDRFERLTSSVTATAAAPSIPTLAEQSVPALAERFETGAALAIMHRREATHDRRAAQQVIVSAFSAASTDICRLSTVSLFAASVMTVAGLILSPSFPAESPESGLSARVTVSTGVLLTPRVQVVALQETPTATAIGATSPTSDGACLLHSLAEIAELTERLTLVLLYL